MEGTASASKAWLTITPAPVSLKSTRTWRPSSMRQSIRRIGSTRVQVAAKSKPASPCLGSMRSLSRPPTRRSFDAQVVRQSSEASHCVISAGSLKARQTTSNGASMSTSVLIRMASVLSVWGDTGLEGRLREGNRRRRNLRPGKAMGAGGSAPAVAVLSSSAWSRSGRPRTSTRRSTGRACRTPATRPHRSCRTRRSPPCGHRPAATARPCRSRSSGRT